MGRDPRVGHALGAEHDFNPLSPHGERRADDRARVLALLISIHSPRMGRDPEGWEPYETH